MNTLILQNKLYPMDKKSILNTVAVAAVLLTTEVPTPMASLVAPKKTQLQVSSNLVEHYDHTHTDAERPINNHTIGVSFISGMKITEFSDHTYLCEFDDR